MDPGYTLKRSQSKRRMPEAAAREHFALPVPVAAVVASGKFNPDYGEGGSATGQRGEEQAGGGQAAVGKLPPPLPVVRAVTPVRGPRP